MSTPLEVMTKDQAADVRRPRPVAWYRTPLDPQVRVALHERSDYWGALQTLGYLGTLVCTGSLAVYSSRHWPWWATVLLVFLHGTCFAFQINAVHELGHGTVFQTRWLNALFERVFSFLGWINFQMFDVSHVRHHQFTLHPPDDLEVVLPIRLMLKEFLKQGFVNPSYCYNTLRLTIRVACGKFCGDWELALFPESAPAKRRAPIRWARTLLIGHGLVVAVALWTGLWILPLLVTVAIFYGAWLFFLCNNTQHIGLQDNVPDFRRCCRTFTLHPFVKFLYWHMNYHIEHHMYAAVPCYRLGELHRLIRHDLPPSPRGIVATWREIIAIQRIQQRDPAHQHAAPCPNPRPKDVDRVAAAALQPAG